MENKPDIVGYFGVGISAVGAIVSIAMENPSIASIPLTVGVGCNMYSRMKLSETLVEAHGESQQAIASLSQSLETYKQELDTSLENNQTNLVEQIKKLTEDLNTKLDKTAQDLKQNLDTLNSKQKHLTEVVNNLETVENMSQELRAKPDSAKFYYQRGVSQENLGNHSGALEDYTETLRRDANYAQAYHKRGVLYLELGEKQKAVDDLRKAALIYFEKGDIESYQKAREMSRKVHDLRANMNGTGSGIIVGDELFS
jgi:tetratricopeptide (TPR) repeat protein